MPKTPIKIQIPTPGFTLAELLMCIAILGIIATFTIPKLLQTQQDGRNRSVAKEAMATISQAYETAKLNGTLTNTMNGWSLTPYMNYAAILPGGTTLDERPNFLGPSFNCGANSCLRLHNGAVLTPYNSSSFAATASGGACVASGGYTDFTLDPDGQYSGTVDSLRIVLSYDGRVGTRAYSCMGTNNSVDDPSWFQF